MEDLKVSSMDGWDPPPQAYHFPVTFGAHLFFTYIINQSNLNLINIKKVMKVGNVTLLSAKYI